MKINENTNIGLPLRNLIGLISAVIIGAWFAFGVIERLNQLGYTVINRGDIIDDITNQINALNEVRNNLELL